MERIYKGEWDDEKQSKRMSEWARDWVLRRASGMVEAGSHSKRQRHKHNIHTERENEAMNLCTVVCR